MMKILHLISTFRVKTDTKWLLRLLPCMVNDDLEISVGCFYDGGPMREKFESMGIATFNLDIRGTFNPLIIPALRKQIRGIDPDIIHTHLLRADIYGGLVGKMLSKPVVSTVYAQGEYRRAKRRSLDPILDRISTCFTSHFIAVCKSIKDDLVSRLNMDPGKITVIQTGIDAIVPDESQVLDMREKLRITGDKPIVLVSARLSYEKGVDCFLRMVKILVGRGIDARFLMAGDGPMRGELQSLAAELGIAGKVEFLGFVSQMEVLMSLADVIVIPSYSEGMPNVALECFAIGTPLVASGVGGVMDLYDYDSESLLLSQPNDPVGLADDVERVISDVDLARIISQRGKRVIETRLSTESVAKRYEKLYGKLAGRWE